MSASMSTFAERVRVAVACYRASDPNAKRVYVVAKFVEVGDHDPRQNAPRPVRRILLVRAFDGQHKTLAHHHTVIVGYDLGAEGADLLAIAFGSQPCEITVTGRSPGAVDAPFDGVVDLRSIELR
jgi:hypothetical protein